MLYYPCLPLPAPRRNYTRQMEFMKQPVEIRPCRLPQDTKKIARYIYETDPYIYPTLFSSAEDEGWVSFIAASLADATSVFSAENIRVATCGEQVIGLVCVLQGGREYTWKMGDLPTATAPQRHAAKTYFKPIIKAIAASRGTYILNICVDEQHGGRGVGTALLDHIVAAYPLPLVLDVVADNARAIRLYEKQGFVKTKAYAGYGGYGHTDVLCWEMQKRA